MYCNKVKRPKTKERIPRQGIGDEESTKPNKRQEDRLKDRIAIAVKESGWYIAKRRIRFLRPYYERQKMKRTP